MELSNSVRNGIAAANDLRLTNQGLEDLLRNALSRERESIGHRVRSAAEVTTDPESGSLADFHRLLVANFRPGEVEDLAVFQNELRGNNDPDRKATFISTALREPLSTDSMVVSGAYGSVDKTGTLAIRFTLTEALHYAPEPSWEGDSDAINTRGYKGFRGYRGTGISQETDRILLEKAASLAPDGKLNAIVAECVDRSEAYWNRTVSIEHGNTMRRLYRPDGKQMFYTLPPLSWNPDGSPASEQIPENLQVAIRGFPKEVPVDVLKGILKNWWETWYFRPREDFNDEAAWTRHCDTVRQVLNDQIFAPLEGIEALSLKSRDERETEQAEATA